MAISISQLKINILRAAVAPRHLLLSALLVSTNACAASPPPATPSAKAPERRGIALYLPLEDNTVLAYATENDQGEKGFFAVQVSRRPDALVELRVGTKSQLLQVSPSEVRHTAGGLLLKWPVEVGNTFRGEFATVRVVATDKAIEVPAGSFTDCVETVEDGSVGAQSQRSTKVFCPNVGLVFFENQARNETETSSQSARLRSFGPKIDVFAEAPPNAP